MDDRELVINAKKDIRNFNFLYEKYVSKLYSYCYSRVGFNKELTEDITSDTFVKAIEKFDSFVYQGKPFIVWLYTIAHNLIVDHYRKSKEVAFADSEEIYFKEEEIDYLENLSEEETSQMILKHTKNLPDELRNIFSLKHTEDLTFKEIAKMVGKEEGAIKMQYYRGLELLKKNILDAKDLLQNN